MGIDDVRNRVKKVFFENAALSSEKDIRRAVAYGRYSVRELNALTSLHKYRLLKKRYSNDS